MTDDPAYKRSQLRLPHELHAAIVKAAENNGRSMNNEIVARLEASFRRSVDDDEVVKVITKLSDGIKTLRADSESAKAKAIVSSAVVLKLINDFAGDDESPSLQLIKSASQRVAERYRPVAEKSSNDHLREALALFDELDMAESKAAPQDSTERANSRPEKVKP